MELSGKESWVQIQYQINNKKKQKQKQSNNKKKLKHRKQRKRTGKTKWDGPHLGVELGNQDLPMKN